MEFSKREKDVLELLCEGFADKEIARKLRISRHTVNTYLTKIFLKLNVRNRTQAAMGYYKVVYQNEKTA